MLNGEGWHAAGAWTPCGKGVSKSQRATMDWKCLREDCADGADVFCCVCLFVGLRHQDASNKLVCLQRGHRGMDWFDWLVSQTHAWTLGCVSLEKGHCRNLNLSTTYMEMNGRNSNTWFNLNSALALGKKAVNEAVCWLRNQEDNEVWSRTSSLKKDQCL